MKHLMIRITLIMICFGMIIGYFNNVYGAFFLFGGGTMSFVYEYFGLIKKYVKVKGNTTEVKE